MIGMGKDIDAAGMEALYGTLCTDGWDVVLTWLDNNLHRKMLELFAKGANTTPEDIKAMDRLRGRDELIRDIAALKQTIEYKLKEGKTPQHVGT